MSLPAGVINALELILVTSNASIKPAGSDSGEYYQML
jgi:hypothetical protein